MKVYEALRFYRPVFQYFKNAGIDADDAKYIDLYDDYCTMKYNGEKAEFIQTY